MKKVAIVGAGISGLTCAQLLKDRNEVTVFEQEQKPGGLVRCERVNGSLFHICGGHVFNTRNARVQEWFWSKFNREDQFVQADRHSAVCMPDGSFVDYPIENHVYQLPESVRKSFYADLNELEKLPSKMPDNFDEFLLRRFGKTLYNLYFKPYNYKVWRRDLHKVPIEWLEGKLPMPTIEEMRVANRDRIEEKSFVHSSFYYGKIGGSQFIADVLSKGISVRYATPVKSIDFSPFGSGVIVNGQKYDYVVFCGNIKMLPAIMPAFNWGGYARMIDDLEYHGTTAVFCEFDRNPYSWFYQPSSAHQSHRIICTGNFSPSNNGPGKMTGTVEFTDEISVDQIRNQLPFMPYHPKYVTHHFSRCTYPIQHKGTREFIVALKRELFARGVHLVGRFAEWEYFNMDMAMASAMACAKSISDGVMEFG